MPTMPTTVTIGPHDYQVTTDRTQLLERCRQDHADLLGHCDPRQLTILIDSDQAAGQARDTLLHECLHAILAANGLADEWGGEREEAVVLRLTAPLLDLLRRNPELTRWLTQ